MSPLRAVMKSANVSNQRPTAADRDPRHAMPQHILMNGAHFPERDLMRPHAHGELDEALEEVMQWLGRWFASPATPRMAAAQRETT